MTNDDAERLHFTPVYGCKFGTVSRGPDGRLYPNTDADIPRLLQSWTNTIEARHAEELEEDKEGHSGEGGEILVGPLWDSVEHLLNISASTHAIDNGEQAALNEAVSLATAEIRKHRKAAKIEIAPVANSIDSNSEEMVERVARAHNLIQRVLDDEETGKGWGPDVTMVPVLREARDILAEARAAIEARRGKT